MILAIRQLWFLLRIGCALLLFDLVCPATEVLVSWQANPEPDVVAYVVVARSGGRDDVVAVTKETDYVSTNEPGGPPSTEATLDLAPGATWSITLTAFNTNGDQSEESDPVEWLGPLPGEPADPAPASGDRGFLFAAGRYWRTGIEDDDERLRITTWSSTDLNEWRIETVCYQDKPRQ